MKEQKWIHKGLITESLPNGMFRIHLDNKDMILSYVSRKTQHSFIQILPGNRVKIKVSHYDSTRGRIVYRLRNKNSKDLVFSQLQHSFRTNRIQDEKF